MSRCLIEVVAYEVTVADILNNEEFLSEFYIFDDKIHECDSEDGLDQIPRTAAHFQDKIVMFDVHPISSVADHEFNEFEKLDFMVDYIEDGLVDIIKNHCPKNSPSDFSPDETFVVIDIAYTKSYDHYSGAYEYDIDIDVVGYLNSNMELMLWK